MPVTNLPWCRPRLRHRFHHRLHHHHHPHTQVPAPIQVAHHRFLQVILAVTQGRNDIKTQVVIAMAAAHLAVIMAAVVGTAIPLHPHLRAVIVLHRLIPVNLSQSG